MALLHPDPSGLIVGWAGAEKFDSDLVRRQYDARPDGDGTIAIVGGQTADTVSVESVLGIAPDLVVATAYMAPARVREERLVGNAIVTPCVSGWERSHIKK